MISIHNFGRLKPFFNKFSFFNTTYKIRLVNLFFKILNMYIIYSHNKLNLLVMVKTI